MKFFKHSLLIGFIAFNVQLHAGEYMYKSNCRSFHHLGLFEQCLDKQLAFYDGKLNGLYSSFGGNKGLEQSELLWIKFKETDCRYMSRAAQDAVRARLVFKACVLEKTKIRINELKNSVSYGGWFKTV